MTNLEAPIEVLPDGSENYGNGVIGPSERDIQEVNSLGNELAKEDIVVASKESLLGRIAEATLGKMPKPVKKLVIPAVALTSLIAAACGGGEANQPSNTTNTPNKSPDATQTIQPNISPAVSPIDGGKGGEKTPVLTATQAPTIVPTEAPKTEAPKANCEILPQELCGGAEVVEYKTLGGTTLRMLGFKDIPAGTKIVAPFAGTLDLVKFGEGGPWNGMGGLFNNPTATKTLRISGDFSDNPPVRRSVDAGGVLTALKDTGVKNYGYDLLIGMTVKQNGIDVDDTASFEALFPGSTSQKAVITLEQTQTGVSRASNLFPGEKP